MSQSALMTPQEAAAFLKLYPDTLKKWRRLGKGPKFHKMGSRCIRYSQKDLQEWLEGISDTHQTTNNKE